MGAGRSNHRWLLAQERLAQIGWQSAVGKKTVGNSNLHHRKPFQEPDELCGQTVSRTHGRLHYDERTLPQAEPIGLAGTSYVATGCNIPAGWARRFLKAYAQ
jgi:hypothetical protein